ncbi:MAG: hypothetical protein ACPLPS_01770 [bacterium]
MSILALLAVALILMGKIFLGYVFLPADMLVHFQPWAEGNLPENDIQWNPLLWDSIAQFYPWRNFLGESLKKGFFPLWNPYQFCGAPFYANGQSAVFYPFSWLTFVFGKYFLGINALLHLFFTGLCLYLFLRKIKLSPFASLFSSLTYMLGAFTTAWLHLPTVLSSFVWAPLSLLAIELSLEGRLFSSFFFSLLSFALSSLGGHPQFLLYTSFLFLFHLLLRIIGEKRITLAQAFIPLLGGGVGLLLSSVSLFPLLELSRLSHRAAPTDWSSYKAYLSLSLPIERLITLFLPNFFGNPAQGNYWGRGEYIEYAIYSGIIPLFFLHFSLKGEKKFAFPIIVIAVLSLLLMLGTPLNIPFYFLFPLWSKTGSPARLISVFTLCLSILTGIGLENALKFPLATRSLILTALTLFIAPFLFLPLAGREEPFSILRDVSPVFPTLDFLKLFLLPSILILIFLFRKRMLPHFLLPLLFLDLFPLARSHLYFSRPKEVFPPLKEISLKTNYRIIAITPHWSLYRYPPACFPPNSAMVYHLYDVSGYDSLFPLYYKSFLDELEGRNTAPLENGNMLLPSSLREVNLRLLGVKYVFSPIYLNASHLKLLKDGEMKVYLYTGEPLRFALIDESFQPQGKVKMLLYEPNKAEFELEANKDGFFIINDTYYPGWKAYMEGREEKIVPFYVFRCVPVPKGTHILSFFFRPFAYKFGLYISLLSCLLLALLFSFKIFLKNRR